MTQATIDLNSWFPAADDVCVCGLGGRTPLGFSAAASAAAVRGAISAITEHPIFVDQADQPISLAWDAGLDPDVEITARMEELLSSAVAEAIAALPPLGGATVQCLLGIPEARPGLPADIARSVTVTMTAFGIPPSAVHIVQRGHASCLITIQSAARKLAAGDVDVCVVAGVDSYHDIETLGWLDRSGRLMSARNRNGFPPGEGAGACVIATGSYARRRGLPILARIIGACTSFEPKGIRTSDVCIGEGLSAAMASLTSPLRLPEQAVTATYCDLNGERYRSEEFVYSLLRVQESFVDAHDYQCPADCWGDQGAASGPLFVSLAIAAHQRGYAKGLYPILWAGSESGYRAAVLLKLGEE